MLSLVFEFQDGGLLSDTGELVANVGGHPDCCADCEAISVQLRREPLLQSVHEVAHALGHIWLVVGDPHDTFVSRLPLCCCDFGRLEHLFID